MHRSCGTWESGNHELLYSRALGNQALLFSSAGSRPGLVSAEGLRADPSSLWATVFMGGRKRLEAVFAVEGPFSSSRQGVPTRIKVKVAGCKETGGPGCEEAKHFGEILLDPPVLCDLNPGIALSELLCIERTGMNFQFVS